MLAHMEGFACRLAARSQWSCALQGRAVRVLRESRAIPARQETRTLLGAGAGISRIRFPVDPIRTVPSKSDAPHRQPLAPLEVLAKLASVKDRPRSARLLEEEFGADPGVATTGAECTEVLNGGGSGGGLQRLGDHAPRTRHECPGAITAAREESAEGLDDSSLEYWSWQPPLLHHLGHFRAF